MPTDADLRLVAETVGFRFAGRAPNDKRLYARPGLNGLAQPRLLPDLQRDDAAAAKYLLPWLQRKVIGGRGVAWVDLHFDHTNTGWQAYYERDFHGEIDDQAYSHGDSLAAALFDLCLSIIRGSAPADEEEHK